MHRFPVSTFEKDICTVQVVPTSIFNASIPMWVFSKNVFNDFEKDFQLLSKLKTT